MRERVRESREERRWVVRGCKSRLGRIEEKMCVRWTLVRRARASIASCSCCLIELWGEFERTAPGERSFSPCSPDGHASILHPLFVIALSTVSPLC